MRVLRLLLVDELGGLTVPRIRTIKPEFWTDGDVVDMSFAARLLFIGSWNFSICDRGHVADDAKRLKMQVLPADDVDAGELIEEIIAHGRMERIEVDGRTYLLIRRFTDHQKIEKRWNPRCPACDGLGLNDTPATSPDLSGPLPTSREERRASPNLSETPPTSAQEGKGKEGKGREGDKPQRKRATQLPEGFQPTEGNVQLAVAQGVDLGREFPKFCDYHRAKGSTMKDWPAALNNWIRKAAEYGNVRPLPGAGESNDWMRRRLK